MDEGLAGPAVLVLGPVASRGPDGRVEPVQGALLRRLLAALALAGRDGRSDDGLVDDVWADDPPRSARGALQMLVSRARAALPDGAIVRTPAGYRLADSDLARAEAGGSADAALALWRGDPGEDLDGELGEALAGRADAALAALLRRRVDALTAEGRAADAVEDARRLAALRPFDGAATAALMAALRDAGRPAEALAAFAAHRERLADELGADPDAAATALNADLLRQGVAETIGLRASTDPLLGRDADLAAAIAAVRAGRLTTIVGPGGLGKTRLAHATGLGLVAAFERIVFVELAGAQTAADVPLVIGGAVGARAARAGRLGDPPPPELAARTREVLAGRRTLLVLDNCEQVVDAVAREVADLLGAVPSLSVLTTSRVPLLVGGERTVAPQPLDPATDGARLFRVRALQARPGALLDEEQVVAVCRRLDGLPLAIELAAARVRSMPLPELAERLDDRFGLLVGGDRTAPERHRTLLAVIDWSWRLLEPGAQAALATLAVFPDGFTAATARTVLGSGADAVTADLVDQSLLVLREAPGAAPRFRMLETVREFGLRALDEQGARAAADAAADAWVLAFAAPRIDRLTGGRDPAAAREVGAEEETLLAVLRDRGPGAPDVVVTAFALLAEWWVLRADFGALAANAPAVVPALPRTSLSDGIVARALVLVAVTLGVSGSPLALRALALLRRGARSASGDGFWPFWLRLLGRVRTLDELPALVEQAATSPDPALACFGALIAGQLLENEGRADEALRRLADADRLAAAHDYAWYRLLARMSTAQLRAQRAEWAAGLAGALAARGAMLDFDPRADTRQVDWTVAVCETGLDRLDDAERHLAALLATPARANDLGDDDVRDVALAALAEVAERRRDAAAADRRWAEALGEGGRRPWALLVRGAAVAARAARGALAPGEARRLRVLLLVVSRLPRGGRLDVSMLAAGALGLSAAVPGEAGAELARLGVRLGARLELGSLAALAARTGDPGARRDDDLPRLLALLSSPGLRAV